MTEAETLSAQLDRMRESYDDAIEAMGERYGKPWYEGRKVTVECSEGFWPYLMIEGVSPDLCLTFRGFHYAYTMCIPPEHREAFLAEAFAHMNYPSHAYDWQEAPDA